MRALRCAVSLSGALAFAAPVLAQDPSIPTPPPTALPPPGSIRPEEPFQELPLLTWQEEMELQSTVRQVIFNAYLPLLARPTDYRGVHEDSIPNQVGDWEWHRPEVQRALRSRMDVVDRQRRNHAALPDAEINHLKNRSIAFRPEQLEPLLITSPRLEDLVVTLRRVQPLGGDVVRVDFDVVTKVNGNVETTRFDSVDIVKQGGIWLLPTRILFEIAPLARIQQAAAAGPLSPTAVVGNFIAIATQQLNDVLPFDLPAIPFLTPAAP